MDEIRRISFRNGDFESENAKDFGLTIQNLESGKGKQLLDMAKHVCLSTPLNTHPALN